MSGFDLLHPALQHHVVNSLGWPALRPLQEESIAPVLDGEHVLAIAPTAGGKTEAAVLPLLSRIATEEWRGLSVLYLCPLRALLNNLHPRLERYGSFVGVRVGLWHGDVGSAERSRIVEDPPEILLTTPESLEATMISTRRDHARFFANLHAVVIDEVHAFGGDDRGWHLLAVLERLSALAGRDLQRIGLSATVGQPDHLIEWLVGSSAGPRRVVAPEDPSAVRAPEITVDHVGSMANAAAVISGLHRGEKRLVFCDSRSRVEELAVGLRSRGVETFVSHSSLAVDERRRAEDAFSQAQDCVIVATSTLELGIDVGDLDRVIQLDSPTTVASFLQRLGRTGRRVGTTRNALFLAVKPEFQVVQTLGLLHLWRSGYVEPVVGPPLPYHLLAQQVLAYVLQEGSISRTRWRDAVGRLPVFAAAAEDGIGDRIIDHLVSAGFLYDDGTGLLSMGPGGETSFGYRHFMELTSAFTSEPLFVVRHGSKELGYLDPIALLTNDRHYATVLLAGRRWKVTSIDWKRKAAWVEPEAAGGKSRWLGSGRPISRELAVAIRAVLAGADVDGVTVSQRAQRTLDELRGDLWWIDDGVTAYLNDGDAVRWWTFGGLRANASLMAALGPLIGATRPDNFVVTLDAERATADSLREAAAAIDVGHLPEPVGAAQFADDLKFSECLPHDIARAVAVARLEDQVSCTSLLDEPIREVDLPS